MILVACCDHGFMIRMTPENFHNLVFDSARLLVESNGVLMDSKDPVFQANMTGTRKKPSMLLRKCGRKLIRQLPVL